MTQWMYWSKVTWHLLVDRLLSRQAGGVYDIITWRLLNRNFIAIYWFEYRTGLHLLTLWNTVTLESAGGKTLMGGRDHKHRKWGGVGGARGEMISCWWRVHSQVLNVVIDTSELFSSKEKRNKQKGDKIMGTSKVATQEAERLDWWRPWEQNIDSDKKKSSGSLGINMHKTD